MTSFFLLYEYNVLFRILEMTQLGEVTKEEKSLAIEKLERFESKVNKNVNEVSNQVTLTLHTEKIYFKVKHNAYLWTITLD